MEAPAEQAAPAPAPDPEVAAPQIPARDVPTRDDFRAAYSAFCQQQGIPFQEQIICKVSKERGAPTSTLDLYDVFIAITGSGGSEAVTAARGWHEAAKSVLQPPAEGVGLLIRQFYEQHMLHEFEDAALAMLPGYGGLGGGRVFAAPPPAASGDLSNSEGLKVSTKKRRRAEGSTERDGSPATPGSVTGRSSGSSRAKGPKAATATSYGRPSSLSDRAILPPHGRGRAPKVLPPIMMQRAAATPPPGSSSFTPRTASDPRAGSASPAPGSKPAPAKHKNGGRKPRKKKADTPDTDEEEEGEETEPSDIEPVFELRPGRGNSGGPGESTSNEAGMMYDGDVEIDVMDYDSDAAVPPDDLLTHVVAGMNGLAAPKRVGVNGVKLVAPYVGEGVMPKPAPVTRSSRARWQQQGFSIAAKNYGNEPLAAMAAWLRDSARLLGHMSPYKPPLLCTCETQAYEEGLNRWRDAEYENQEVPLPQPHEPGHRRSGRVKSGVNFFVPTFASVKPNDRQHYLEDEESDDEKETREGPDFQATLPPLQTRPQQGPPPEEAKWLACRILGPGQLAARRPPPNGAHLDALPLEERLKVEAAAVAALRAELGPHAVPLGLDLMGGIAGTDWQEHEAALLEQGMRLVGRDFRRIAVSLLPGRREADLILYYYNVWKTRATPRARAWFAALEQARRLEEAEEAAERARVAEAEAKRIAAHSMSVQNRQLREAVNWLRTSARWPRESLLRPKCRERMIRVKALLAAQNCEAEHHEMPSSPYSG